MKIVVFGASGKTGSLLVAQALEKGYKVVAYVRKGASDMADHPNLKIVVGNLNETLKLRDAITGADACFSLLGGKSLIRRSPEFTQGISNIIEAMEKENVHRFIYMSSIGAGQSRFMIPQPVRFYVVNVLLRVPLADHNRNESLISASNLRWTVVRPATLTDGPFTGNLQYGTGIERMHGNRSVSRSNVAAFMLDQLDDETYRERFVWVYE